MTSKKLRIIGILNVNDTGAIMSPVIREKRLIHNIPYGEERGVLDIRPVRNQGFSHAKN